MRVVHLPSGEANPYQENLAEGLRANGVEATAVELSNPIIFAVLRTLWEYDADVAHLHWLDVFYAGDNVFETAIKSVLFLFELLALELLGYSLVWTIHNRTPHDTNWPWYHEAFRHLAFRFCDAVVVHCEVAADEVIETFGLNEAGHDKLHVIPHGNYNNYPNEIEQTDARERLSLPAESMVFVFVGQLRPYKGIEKLLDVFSQIPDENLRLVVAGKPVSTEYERSIRNLITDDRIKLVAEFVPDDELQLYLNAADVMVLPYDDILTSGSAMLALSFGRPVVAPDIGCNAELLGRDAAILYQPKEGIEYGLQLAIKDDLARRMDAAHARATELGWDRIGRQTRSMYSHISGS